MLDGPATVGLRPAVLVADTGYGANADFRHGPEDHGPVYALQAKGEMTARSETAEPYELPYGGLGPRPLPAIAPGLLACANTSKPGPAGPCHSPQNPLALHSWTFARLFVHRVSQTPSASELPLGVTALPSLFVMVAPSR